MMSRASYRFSANKIQRSIVGPIAYAGGLRLLDERTGILHNFASRRQSGRDDVVESMHFSPSVVSETLGSFWNRISEQNKNHWAVYGRRLLHILPRGLSLKGMWRAARLFARYLSIKYSVAVFTAMHGPRKSTDRKRAFEERDEIEASNGNWHVHTYLSYCTVDRDGTLGLKQVLLDPKSCAARGLPNFCEVERPVWAECVNRQLAREGSADRVDHRSNKDRGIADLPTEHLGPHFAAQERRGIATRVGDRNRAIRTWNRRVQRGARHVDNLQAFVDAISSHTPLADTMRPGRLPQWRAKVFHSGRRSNVRAFSRSLEIVLMNDGGSFSLDGDTVVILQSGTARQARNLLNQIQAEIATDVSSVITHRLRHGRQKRGGSGVQQNRQPASIYSNFELSSVHERRPIQRLIPLIEHRPDPMGLGPEDKPDGTAPDNAERPDGN